jgi:hypothetical protein
MVQQNSTVKQLSRSEVNTRKFLRGLPSDMRLFRGRVLNCLRGNTPSSYKYTYRPQVEDFVGAMAAAVGLFCLITPGGQPVGACLLAMATVVGLWHYPSPAKRRAQEFAEINRAGQDVTGKRGDLYRLDFAQRQILALTRPFNQAAVLPDVVVEKINGIASSAEPARARIETADGKPYALVRKHIVTTLVPIA